MTETMTNHKRVSVIDGWAVRDLPNGDQVRAQLHVDRFGGTDEPERDGTGVLLVRESSGYHGTDLDEHDGLARVLDRIDHDGRHWWVIREAEDQERMFESGMGIRDYWKRIEHEFRGGEVEAHEFVRRYLRAFWGVEDAFLFRHHGYSQSDWSDIWVIVESVRPYGWDEDWTISREGAESVVQEWSDWAKGDCYYVESEYRTLADAMEADDFDEGWTDHDTLHGGIGDGGALSILHQVLYVSGYGDVDHETLPRPFEVTAD